MIRKKIRQGKIEEANKLLKRDWCIEGKVIKGHKRGRKIGFPTCNLKMGNYVIPKLGVYAVKVKNADVTTDDKYFLSIPIFIKKFITLELGLGALDKKTIFFELLFKFSITSIAFRLRLIPLCITPHKSITNVS